MVMITTGIFAGMDDSVLRSNLTGAQQALIDLQSGKSMVTMSYAQGDGSKSVTRKMGTVAECTALIRQLQQALGIRHSRRPMRFVRL